MTGPWTGRENGLALIGMLLCLSVGWCTGNRNGHLNEKLSENKTQLISQDSVTKLVTRAVDSSKAVLAKLDSTHDVVRTKVRVVRDSVFVRDTVYVDPDIAHLIQYDDSLIAAQKKSLALQDTLIAQLRVGVKLRDDRINLLEKQHSPRLGIKSGMAIGTVSTVAIVVVAVKVIQAFHK